MPEAKTMQAVRKDNRQGKSPTTQAGEFVREEIHHIREGKHGARSTKQAIAIGLSKARRAGIPLGTPRTGSKRTKDAAKREGAGASSRGPPQGTRRARPSQRRASGPGGPPSRAPQGGGHPPQARYL